MNIDFSNLNQNNQILLNFLNDSVNESILFALSQMPLKLHERQATRELILLITEKFQNDNSNKKLHKRIIQSKKKKK